MKVDKLVFYIASFLSKFKGAQSEKQAFNLDELSSNRVVVQKEETEHVSREIENYLKKIDNDPVVPPGEFSKQLQKYIPGQFSQRESVMAAMPFRKPSVEFPSHNIHDFTSSPVRMLEPFDASGDHFFLAIGDADRNKEPQALDIDDHSLAFSSAPSRNDPDF